MRSAFKLICGTIALLTLQTPAAESRLPGTELLSTEADRSVRMVAGIDQFLMREIDRSLTNRTTLWQRDFSSASAYEHSIETNRQRFRMRIGAVDARLPI